MAVERAVGGGIQLQDGLLNGGQRCSPRRKQVWRTLQTATGLWWMLIPRQARLVLRAGTAASCGYFSGGEGGETVDTEC